MSNTALYCTETAHCHRTFYAVAVFLRLLEVVGYAKPDLAAGFSFVGVQFDKIDGTAVKLSDIKLENGAGDSTEIITMLDEEGQVAGSYTWLTEAAAGMPDGWYDFSTWESVDFELTEGQGLYVNTMAAGAKVVTSGLVASTAKTIALPVGFSIVANCSPVDIDLQDLVLINGAGDSTEIITMLDAEGQVSASYTWLTEAVAGMPDGWYDFATWELIEGVTIKAGEALYMNCMAEGASLVIPAALGE